MSSSAPTAQAAVGAVAEPTSGAKLRTPAKSIALVVLCTIIGAAAQILMRAGADYLDEGGGILAILMNWRLLAGYACLAANTLLLVIALREGQLSVLYPIIALTYVWVAILSPMFFPDTMNVFKVIGITLVVCGVSMIGAGSRR